MHKLRLRLVLLKGMHAANRLIVDRAALAMSWLERLGASVLVHLKVAHVLLLRLVDGWWLLLAPIAFKVTRAGPAMPLATTAAKVWL